MGMSAEEIHSLRQSVCCCKKYFYVKIPLKVKDNIFFNIGVEIYAPCNLCDILCLK